MERLQTASSRRIMPAKTHEWQEWDDAGEIENPYYSNFQ